MMPYFLIGRRSVIRGGVFLWEKAKMGVARENRERESCGSSSREGERTRAGSIEWVLNEPPFCLPWHLLICDHCFCFVCETAMLLGKPKT